MQKFLINIFEWIKVLNSIKMYHNEESHEGYFLEVDVQDLEKVHDLPFLPERIKIKKTEKLDMLH